MQVSTGVFNFNVLALVVSEILGGFKFTLRGPASPRCPPSYKASDKLPHTKLTVKCSLPIYLQYIIVLGNILYRDIDLVNYAPCLVIYTLHLVNYALDLVSHALHLVNALDLICEA